MLRGLSVLFVSSLVASCQPPPSPAALDSAERDRIVAEVDGVVRDYVEAIRSQDVDRMLAFWADVDGFAMSADGNLLVGYDTWADQLRSDAEATSEVTHIEIARPVVHVLGRNAASYSMEFEWSMTGVDGGTTNATGAWTYVLERFPDGWKVVQSGGTHLFS